MTKPFSIIQTALTTGLAMAAATQIASAAVTASFNPDQGTLTVIGDHRDNVISVSQGPDGAILVNGGTIDIEGGYPTEETTHIIEVFGRAGDDDISAKGLSASITVEGYGGKGNDFLEGGAGNDLLSGGRGNDFLDGGAGQDSLLGNRGNDIVLGQDGNDLLIVNNGDGSDFLEGGEDIDTVQVYGDDGAGDDFSIDPNGERVRLERHNLERFTLDIGTVENLQVNGRRGNDIIVGSVGLNGLISLDLDGGEGNDLLIGGAGRDFLDGGKGNDTLEGGPGNDRLLGNRGNDVLIGDEGRDFCNGGNGNDTAHPSCERQRNIP